MKHIAVLDIGKTNAKLALVDADSLAEIAVITRPNTVLPGPPYPHFDVAGHWRFFLHGLHDFQASHGIDAISITTHGAAAVMLDAHGALAAPVLDYEHKGPDDLAALYDPLRPDFAQTGAPRLPMGLNLGAQLHWLLETQAGLGARAAHVLTYPQYWAYLLTGVMACDVTSLGCHTDLWNPFEGRFSELVHRLGLEGRFAPARRPQDVLGAVTAEIAAQTGLAASTPVACGIHDSNASLYPYVLGRAAPFSVVSTGTWVVVMAVGGSGAALDPARDVLVNVNALGGPVPSARFMGGREYEMIRDGSETRASARDRAAVMAGQIMLLPAVEQSSGPFAGRQMSWTAPPATAGQKRVALGHYLALMTQTCATLVGARGPMIIEGPFAKNPDFLDMLAALRPEGVEVATSATGTSVGAALLCVPHARPPESRRIAPPINADILRAMAAMWRAKTS